jgi:imidazolonepropionase
VVTSFLGAHALPPEADGDKERYIDEVCALIPTIVRNNLADAVDAFCESIAFSPEQTDAVFVAAQGCGTAVKLHADQLSNLHGAGSQPHTGHSRPTISSTRRGWRCGHARARAPSPCCCPAHFMCCARSSCRRSRAFVATALPMAIATDSNPGTSPITSLF